MESAILLAAKCAVDSQLALPACSWSKLAQTLDLRLLSRTLTATTPYCIAYTADSESSQSGQLAIWTCQDDAGTCTASAGGDVVRWLQQSEREVSVTWTGLNA